MAVLNELGRNSAAITYGAVTTGADLWPTFATVDKWLRNDTLQGTATASSTNVTGSGSLFLTQLRANDIVMIAGQSRIVASVVSDSSFTVTVAFSPAISVASSIKILNPAALGTTLLGTVTNSNAAATYPNFTVGTVSVATGSNVITGVGTYFLSECTNAVDAVAITGTVAIGTNGTITGSGTAFLTSLQPGDSLTINDAVYLTVATVDSDTSATVRIPPGSAISAGATIKKATNGTAGRTIVINGRVRIITSITSNTQMSVTPSAPFDFTDSNLQYKMMPRGTITTTAASINVTGVSTNFYWDLPNSAAQVWVGDELRTFTFSSPTAAVLSDVAGFTGTSVQGKYPVSLSGISFKAEDSLLTYTPGASALSAELRVGDDLIIDGNEVTVTKIISDTQFKVSIDMPAVTAETVYKKKKIHGYVLEGTREGTSGNATQVKYSSAGLVYINATSLYGSNTITINAAGPSHVAGNFIKIQNGGGAPVQLTGTVTASSNTITGDGTFFTTQLHVGAEIYFGGVYCYVASITNNTSMTVTPWSGTITNATAAAIYRTTPLYTFITSVSSNTITLYHPLKNTVYANSTFGPGVQSPAYVAGDYIEFVYSSVNKSAEASIALYNTSLDRKYIGFRYYPVAGSTVTVPGANAAYNLVVYERWVAGWSQSGGVGLNKADCSDRVTALNNVTDQTAMTQQSGGFLYLFAKPRYFVIQGKSFANIQTQWLGCVEFERVQPEDTGSGLGTATPTGGTVGAGYTYYGYTLPAEGYTITPQVSPWPCFAYFNSNRFPVGATQAVTLPIANSNGVHGCVFAVPRIRSSVADLVGVNAHVYSAATITTGRWGHLYEMGAGGSYVSPGSVAGNVLTTTASTIPQPHLGNLVPVNTNVYNSKRFMFSPVVVLGTAWDPDIRGRIYGLKVIPSALGTLMDTVSVTTETTDDFYSANGTSTDHWVITAPGVTTYHWSVFTTTTNPTSGYRSLEDATGTTTPSSWAVTTFPNNFRFAIPT
jgi:hypothetical protein